MREIPFQLPEGSPFFLFFFLLNLIYFFIGKQAGSSICFEQIYIKVGCDVTWKVWDRWMVIRRRWETLKFLLSQVYEGAHMSGRICP